jgi:hypothetical protein
MFRIEKVQEKSMGTKTFIRALGLVAILSGLLAIMADIVSIFTTTADLSQMGLSLSLQNIGVLLVEKPNQQLVLGHYLAMLAIPVAGISVVTHTALGMLPAGRLPARLFFFSGLFVVSLGVAYHGVFGAAGEVVKYGDPDLIARVNAFFEPFGVVVSGLFLALVLSWSALILTGRSHYPRWTLYFSPLPVLAMSTTFAFLLPFPITAVRVFLMVTNMNLPITIWAVISTIVLWNVEPIETILTGV